MTFASTVFGATSSDSPQILTVENVGNASLTFPAPASGTNPSIAPNFTLGESGESLCPVLSAGSSTVGTLFAGHSCALPIGFLPLVVGSVTGDLVLTDNAPNAPSPGYATQTIQLNGTGLESTVACVNNLGGAGTKLRTAGRIDLSWTGIPSASGYEVLRSSTNGGPYTEIGTTANSAYSDQSGLVQGDTYYYVLQPTNAAGARICQSNQATIAVP